MSGLENRASGAAQILWLRRDLRLGDHPAMVSALSAGEPVVPLFIWDPVEEALLGAAARWRLMKSLQALSRDFEAIGARLVIRRGDALETLRAVAKEAGAAAVHWSRYYDARFIQRDSAVKAGLREDGLEAHSHPGFLLREPFETTTQSGGFFKVYSPFKRAFLAAYDAGQPFPKPRDWPAPASWPKSLSLDALELDKPMRRGAAVLERALEGDQAGERAAEARLQSFLEHDVAEYADRRDRLDLAATSRLSAPLAFGEIAPSRLWIAAKRVAALEPGAQRGAEKFLDEVIWREFAWHLAYHTPHIRESNWRDGWDAFPWRGAEEGRQDFDAWRKGRTGVDVVDAAMRELYVTGLMHNRARMITASYLTKHLLIDWRLGERWFADCLIDFDPASNAMGWQWVAGSGPDAAPFFRIFNPETQAEKFDPEGRYRARWLPARDMAVARPPAQGSAWDVDGSAFFDACPRSWEMSQDDDSPTPSISLKSGRERALAAYEATRS